MRDNGYLIELQKKKKFLLKEKRQSNGRERKKKFLILGIAFLHVMR